jgi:hypothetical protein
MKYGSYFFLGLCLVFTAWQVAQNKMNHPLLLETLHLGMSIEEVEQHFGSPSAESRNYYTFILQDGSELLVTLRDNAVSSAQVKFHRTIKIQDPEMRKLTLVQMQPDNDENNDPTWFFAGKPEEGLIYKITSQGTIESLTWVPPFTYGNNRPKHLQALLRDFKTQRSM